MSKTYSKKQHRKPKIAARAAIEHHGAKLNAKKHGHKMGESGWGMI